MRNQYKVLTEKYSSITESSYDKTTPPYSSHHEFNIAIREVRPDLSPDIIKKLIDFVDTEIRERNGFGDETVDDIFLQLMFVEAYNNGNTNKYDEIISIEEAKRHIVNKFYEEMVAFEIQQRATAKTKGKWDFRGTITEEEKEKPEVGNIADRLAPFLDEIGKEDPDLASNTPEERKYILHLIEVFFRKDGQLYENEPLQNYWEGAVEWTYEGMDNADYSLAIEEAIVITKDAVRSHALEKEEFRKKYTDWKKAQNVQQRATAATKGKWNFGGSIISENATELRDIGPLQKRIDPLIDELLAIDNFADFFATLKKNKKLIMDIFRFDEYWWAEPSLVRAIVQTKLKNITSNYNRSFPKTSGECIVNILEDCHHIFYPRGTKGSSSAYEPEIYIKGMERIFNILQDVKKVDAIQQRATAATKGRWNFGGGIIAETNEDAFLNYPYKQKAEELTQYNNFDDFYWACIKIKEDLRSLKIRCNVPKELFYDELRNLDREVNIQERDIKPSLTTSYFYAINVREEPGEPKDSLNSSVQAKNAWNKWREYYVDAKKAQTSQQRATDATKGKWNFKGGIVSESEGFPFKEYAQKLANCETFNDFKMLAKTIEAKIIVTCRAGANIRLTSMYLELEKIDEKCGFLKKNDHEWDPKIETAFWYVLESFKNYEDAEKYWGVWRKNYLDYLKTRDIQQRATNKTKGKWNFKGGII